MTETKLPDYPFSNICPECGGVIIHTARGGDTVCSSCGLVISEKKITINPERHYSEEERRKRSRVGKPISKIFYVDLSYTTVINKKKILYQNLKRAVRWDARASANERGLLVALTEFKRLGTLLNIPKYVSGSAILFYRKMKKLNQLRGRSIQSMVKACLFCSCRIHEIPRTAKEIIEDFDYSDIKRKVLYCIKVILKELCLNLPPPDPSLFIHRYCVELGLNGTVQQKIREVYLNYNRHTNTSGKSPLGIIGGIIYLVAKLYKLDVTQTDISEALGVTEVTVRSRYTDVRRFLGIL